MNLLFCHDGPIERYGNDYFGIGFTDELFSRYKVIADNISIAMRVHNNVDLEFNTSKFLKLSSEYNVIECPNISSIRGQLFLKRKCYNILNDAIKSNDLIIIRLPSFIGNIAVDVCKTNNRKYYVELVGCPWDALWNHSHIGKIIAPIMYFKTRSRVKRADYVQYVTNEFLQRRYPTFGKSVGCSDVQLLVNQSKKNYYNMIKYNSIKIGTIGVIDIKYKGQIYVIKAMEKLLKSGINVKYELVGAGDRKKLMNYARAHNVLDNISFLGPMKHDDIFKWLESIDIYIQPSTTEGLPRSLIEAMSVGCLCIASNAGGMPELLSENFVFKKKNYRQLYKIIMSLTYKDFKKQSDINYKIAKEFSVENLRKVRNSFLKKYKKEIVINETK